MVERVEVLEEALIRGRKIINWIGSSNSGKSDDMATIINALMVIDPEYTRGFLAGPYKKSSDATTWPRVISRAEEVKKTLPAVAGAMRTLATKERIVFSEAHAETGYIELITLDKVGRLQGMKARDQGRGFVVLLCDEIAEFQTKAMLDLLDNIGSNRNLLCITSCNFTDENDLAGDLCRPQFGSYRDLHPDKDFKWDSYMDSITVRFDGHQSPNIRAGHTLYPYLIDQKRIETMARTHTTEGPRYMAQVRSFPATVEGEERVLTEMQVRAGGCYERYSLDQSSATRIMALDPGFGGDPCVAQIFEFGMGLVSTVDGRMVESGVFRPVAAPMTIQLERDKVADAAWVKRLQEASQTGSMQQAIGRSVDYNQQIAVKVLELMNENRIPRDMLVFDGSMRAGIVQSIVSIISFDVVALSTHGSPTDRVVTGGERANDIYANLIAELHFAFQALVFSGQLRDAAKIPAAIEQLCRRAVHRKGPKIGIETKQTYKRSNKNKSPDEADVCVMALEFARRKGFELSYSLRPSSARNKAVDDMMDRLSLSSFTGSRKARPFSTSLIS